MKLKTDDVLIYKNTQLSSRYGTGVVTLITADEYAILWSGRGLTRYKRAILDRKLDEVFQRAEKDTGLPKERHLHLGAAKTGIPFNENYDRAKIALLCEGLKNSGSRKVKDVADLLAAELITKKLTARGAAKGHGDGQLRLPPAATEGDSARRAIGSCTEVFLPATKKSFDVSYFAPKTSTVS